MQIFKIHRPNLKVSGKLARIHKKVLKESFLTSLGFAFLKSTYPLLISNRHNIVIVAKENKQIVGYLVATLNNTDFLKPFFKLTSVVSLLPKLIPVFIKKPRLLLTLVKWFLTKKQYPPSPELQFIAIEPKYQRRGIGTKMIQSLNAFFLKKRIKSYLVSTKSDNRLSNRFYKKLGYKLAFRENVFGDNMNYYLLNLKTNEK